MGLSMPCILFLGAAVVGLCLGKDVFTSTSTSAPSSSSQPPLSSTPELTSEAETEANNFTSMVKNESGLNQMVKDEQPRSTLESTPAQSLWLKCVSQISPGDFGNDNIAKVLKVWCQNYEKIVDCLSGNISDTVGTNPLDFFIGLNFNKGTLLDKSKNVCAKLQEIKETLSCVSTSNKTLEMSCAGVFSSGLVHLFSLHRNKNFPTEILLGIACEETLPDCQEDTQTTLLGYYSLFTNDTCIAQAGQEKRPFPMETVVTKCAREASQILREDQEEPEPTSLVDFLILGLKTDCKTYPARYACYERELNNITNFRDFWLSLTFEHDNAVASQKAYCQQIHENIIPQITDDCFNESQPALTDCEADFGREVEAIREEWFNNSEFDGLQLQTLACRTSVTRAACLDNAMQACGEQVARAMAISEMGILPSICQRLLTLPQKDNPISHKTSIADTYLERDGDNQSHITNNTRESEYRQLEPESTNPADLDRLMSDEAAVENLQHDHSDHRQETTLGSDGMLKPTSTSEQNIQLESGMPHNSTKHDNTVSASKILTGGHNAGAIISARDLYFSFHIVLALCLAFLASA